MFQNSHSMLFFNSLWTGPFTFVFLGVLHCINKDISNRTFLCVFVWFFSTLLAVTCPNPNHPDTNWGFISRWNRGHSLLPEKGCQRQSQSCGEAICLRGSWAGWSRCYLLPMSPLWPLTNQLTGMTGRRLSDSCWLPSHCLGSNSGQLAGSLWGRYLSAACVHACNVERLAGKHNRNAPQMYIYIFFKRGGGGEFIDRKECSSF